MRLNRYLAWCGLGSRRAVEQLIRAGRVRVNGEDADLAQAVVDGDRVEVDEKPVYPPSEPVYGMLNKPVGVLCSRGDTHGRTTVYHLLPKDWRALHSVGRLDRDSRGLLLFTNDGALTQGLTHPRHGVLRTYAVRTAAPLSEDDQRRLRQGVEVEPGVIFQCATLRLGNEGFELGLREGKKREIRRLLASLGHRVVDLRRIAFGGVELGNLPEGASRLLSRDEVEILRQAAALDAAAAVVVAGAARPRRRPVGRNRHR